MLPTMTFHDGTPGLDVSLIPRGPDPQWIVQNAALWDFDLTGADLAAIARLDRTERCGPDPLTFE